MTYNFDEIIDRHNTSSAKWEMSGMHAPLDPDVLPLWVADMDFRSPPAVLEAIHRRVDHGVFGYTFDAPGLRDVIVERMQRRYGWTIQPEHIVYLPGLVAGLNVVSSAFGKPGDGILMTTPVYMPFLSAPGNQGRFANTTELLCRESDHHLHYEVDFDAFESAITPQTRTFILCNPHNPVGRVYRHDELEQMADICLRHNLIICSDEIHCDLMMDGVEHIPVASLSPEVADRTITMMAPSKTYNLPGLATGFAIIPNADLRKAVEDRAWNVGHANALGLVAAQAAYQHGQDWLDELLAYLQANRDYALDYLREHAPTIRTTVPEGTYLLWMDCREAGIMGNPMEFFYEQARVSLNDGAAFGRGGEGFVRLNLGCPRSMLTDALTRIGAALAALE